MYQDIHEFTARMTTLLTLRKLRGVAARVAWAPPPPQGTDSTVTNHDQV